jgi:NAD(P)-dependent dehydrogenase (short-subunit alcohol dehydrogenase family)
MCMTVTAVAAVLSVISCLAASPRSVLRSRGSHRRPCAPARGRSPCPCRRRFPATAAYRAYKQAARILTWALADELKDKPVTANGVNPGYVLTPLTRNAAGPLKLLVALTGFAAQTAFDGADIIIWAATRPELEGVTGKFWTKRHEIPCRFRSPAEIHKLRAIVEQQLAEASSLEAGTAGRAAASRPSTQNAR